MFSRFKFKKSKLVEVIIWNSFNEKFIIDILPSNIKFEVLEISKKRVDFIFETKFIFYLIYFSLFNKINSAWAISLIKMFNPKIIITYNTTTPFNEKLILYYKNIKFYHIQYSLEAPNHVLSKYQNYLAWGNHSFEFFKKNSIKYLSYNIIGSMKMANYLEQKFSKQEFYDIAFISTYRYTYETLDLKLYSKKEKNYYLPLFKMLYNNLILERELIYKIGLLGKFKISLLLSNSEKTKLEKEAEISFYQKIHYLVDIKQKIDLSSYHFSYTANIIITTDSSLGFEMLGACKKVIFLLNSNEIRSYYDYIGIDNNYFIKLPTFLKASTNFEDLYEKIIYLKSLSDDKYRELTIEARNEFCIDSSKTKSKFLKALNLQNDY